MMKNDMNELDMELLEEVSGGRIGEVAYDSDFLKDMGVISESFSTFGVMFNWGNYSEAVDDGWAKLGIICCTSPTGDNTYSYQGRELTRIEAMELGAELCGKTIDVKKYIALS